SSTGSTHVHIDRQTACYPMPETFPETSKPSECNRSSSSCSIRLLAALPQESRRSGLDTNSRVAIYSADHHFISRNRQFNWERKDCLPAFDLHQRSGDGNNIVEKGYCREGL